METVACNLCGSEQASVLIDQLQDWLLGSKIESGKFTRCDVCGLVYLNPRFTPEEIRQHYPENYDPFQRSRSKGLHQITRLYSTKKRTRLVTSQVSSGRILDIGCATGEFLAGIQKQGNWETYGVEPDAYAAGIAKQQPGLQIFIGFLRDAGFKNEIFDVVTLWDVLEHVPDPLGELIEIHRVLKPGGLLVIRIPNSTSTDARWWGKYWAGLDYPRHLYLFSNLTLNQLLQKANLHTIDYNTNIGAYPTWLLSMRFWLQARLGNKVALKIYHLLMHPIFQLIASPVFLPVSALGKGPIMVVRARKQL